MQHKGVEKRARLSLIMDTPDQEASFSPVLIPRIISEFLKDSPIFMVPLCE